MVVGATSVSHGPEKRSNQPVQVKTSCGCTIGVYFIHGKLHSQFSLFSVADKLLFYIPDMKKPKL